MSGREESDWRKVALDALHDVQRRNGTTAARAMVDAFANRAQKPWGEDNMLRVPAHIGPWAIVQEGDGFKWKVAENVSANDQLRFHVQPHATARSRLVSSRVLLIGESAAGSWGFFGKLSIARLVELAVSEKHGECEVLDLTCVNANWRDNCLPLLSAGMTLDPDVVVIFCGNNEARWLIPTVLHDLDTRHVDGFDLRWSYLTGDMPKTLDQARCAYLSGLEAAVYDTVATCRAFGKPVLFVIPPYNFRAWKPPEQFPVLLAEKQRIRWAELIERATLALERGANLQAMGLADAAVSVDDRESQLALYLRGLAKLQLGDSSADQDLHDAMYAGLGAFVQAVPSLPLPAAHTLAKALNSLDVPAVDLVSKFAEEDPDEADPLFLDYCHLGRRGSAIAAQEIAKVVCAHLRQPPEVATPTEICDGGAVWSALSSEGGRTECAIAFVCAALHGHQNGQSARFVGDWLRRALRETNAVVPLLRLLRGITCTYHREWLTLDGLRHEGISPDVVDDRTAIFILKFIYHARLDFELSTMLAEVLGEVEPTSEIDLQTVGQLKRLGGDLKRMFFLDVRKGFGLCQREMSRREWERPGREFVATDYKGRVDFFGDRDKPIDLLLCISPPCRDLNVICRLHLNGKFIAELLVERLHSRFRLPIRSVPFNLQLNTLSFEWDRMVGAADLGAGDHRASFVTKFGPYPIAAVVSELRFDFNDSHGDTGSRWL